MPKLNIVLPQIPDSETILKIEWLFSEGEFLRKGQIVAEVELSQVIMEVPSPGFGHIESLFEVGLNAPHKNKILGVIEIGNYNQEVEKTPEEKRMEKYCCSSMYYAVTSANPHTKFHFQFFRGENLWFMGEAPSIGCSDIAKFCPWCGGKLPDHAFE